MRKFLIVLAAAIVGCSGTFGTTTPDRSGVVSCDQLRTTNDRYRTATPIAGGIAVGTGISGLVLIENRIGDGLQAAAVAASVLAIGTYWKTVETTDAYLLRCTVRATPDRSGVVVP